MGGGEAPTSQAHWASIFNAPRGDPGTSLGVVAKLSPLYTLICWAVLASAAYAAGTVVLVGGPPGSVRSIEAAILKQGPGMAVIAADEVWTHTWILP